MDAQITDEESFENSHSQPVDPVSPSTKKGTHPTNPINPNSKTSERKVVDPLFEKYITEASPSSVIEQGAVGSHTVVEDARPGVTSLQTKTSEKKERDRINNLVQKEKSLEKAGLSREKYMAVIARQLNKKKVTETRDVAGNVVMVEVDDDVAQRWAVEKLSVIFGDMIERKEIEHDLGDKTLDRFKSLSVAELKARAADLLLGKPVSRLGPVIDV